MARAGREFPPERGPGWHVIPTAFHGETTEGETAAENVECFRYLETETNISRRQGRKS